MSTHNTAENLNTGEDRSKDTAAAASERLSALPGSSEMRDINRMMDALEQNLDKLDKKLGNSNRKTRKDIRELLASDAEIGDKVAEIYRQLGLVDARFTDLKKDSGTIRQELDRLLDRIESVREQSLQALADSLENQGAINLDLQQAQQSLIERAETLAKKTTALTRRLNKSIKDNSQALTELEARIVSELERVADDSEKRDEALDGQLQQHQARMLRLQRVDEALDKRAGQLETLTGQLLDDSETLQQQTEMLSVVTERLNADLEALQLKSARLEVESLRHRGLIEQLQHSGRELGQSLLALGRREDRRFIALSLFGLLLLVALLALFGYGQLQRSEDSLVLEQRAVDTQNQIQDLQTRVLDEQMISRVSGENIHALQQKVAKVEKQLVMVKDQIGSLDGRIGYIAPFSGFGGDNVIHGSEWLSRLDPRKYSIRISGFESKQALFDLVQRYNHYLTQPLGYYPNGRGGYDLVYGGDFADAGEVEENLRWMPGSMDFRPLETVSNRQILSAISR